MNPRDLISLSPAVGWKHMIVVAAVLASVFPTPGIESVPGLASTGLAFPLMSARELSARELAARELAAPLFAEAGLADETEAETNAATTSSTATSTATTPNPSQEAARIEGDAELQSSVGMLAWISGVVLPGSELTVRKVDPRSAAVMLRIDAVYPHGDSFRYDIAWMAYEPGPHNLIDYLSRKDGTETASLPAISVTALSVLPGDRMLPNELQNSQKAKAGGYRLLLWIVAVVWLIGLAAIFAWNRKNAALVSVSQLETPLTRLQQIEIHLQAAADRPEEFSPASKAHLEGLVLSFWRDKKQLEESTPAEAIEKLREDEEAGPLLQLLQRWLYDRPERQSFDLQAMLAPFRKYIEGVHRRVADTVTVTESSPAESSPSELSSTSDAVSSTAGSTGGSH